MTAPPFTDALLAATEQHPQARVSLTAALANDTASHAYLFHGPRGSGKSEAARAFAAALLAIGAPDPQSAYERALRGAHQDLTWVTPSGAHEMLKQDVVPILRSASMTPMEGERQVFVLDRAHTIHEDSANRMLKTLEEPPPATHFILLSSEPSNVLPTIFSRCQAVRFDAISTKQIADQLSEEGIDAIRAASCAALAGGDTQLARDLASDDGDVMRSQAGRIVGCALRGVSGRERPWEAILARATEAGELAEQAQRTKLEEQLEAFPKGRERTAAAKEGEQAAHRTARRVRSDSLDRSLRIAALLIRDLATAASGNEELILAADRRDSILKTAQNRPVGPLLSAAGEIDETRLLLKRNVAEDLALQALSFKLDRVLAGV